MQSQEEIKIVSQYWVKNLAPEGFLDLPENGEAMIGELVRRGYAVVTFENLTEACNALGDKATGGGIAYAPKTTKPVEPVVQKTTWKGPSRPSNVADVNAERQQFAEAVADINGPTFARIQDEARDEFNKICNGYQASTPMGKVDHALTSERRALLRGLKVVDKRRNNRGEEVVLFTNMLQLANEALRAFEKEDINRNQQRW
jgi:hypothetical protein